MKKIKCTLVLLFTLSLSNSLHAQTLIGDPFAMDAFFGRAGRAISMSEDGSRIVVGQPGVWGNDVSSYVQVFDFNGSLWVPVGSKLQSLANGEQFGTSVSMNADGTRFVVGALKSDVNGMDSGYAKIYEYQDTGGGVFDWVEIGYLQGDIGDEFGASVSMNAVGDFVAIGSPNDDTKYVDSGSIKMFAYINGSWEPHSDIFGNTTNNLGTFVIIEGSSANQHIGRSVRLTEDGNKIVLRGDTVVKAYKISSVKDWDQEGSDLPITQYEELGDNGTNFIAHIHEHENTLGISSSNTPRIIVGDPYATVNGNNYSGLVKVYELMNNVWQQVGQDIEGSGVKTRLGHSVGISSDGNRISIGNLPIDYLNDSTKKVYDYSGTSWDQYGVDIGSGLVPSVLQNTLLTPKGNICAYADVNFGFLRLYRISQQATISTTGVSSVSPFEATLEGNIVSDGRGNITEKGFVYSTTDASPMIGASGVDQIVSGNNEIGVFTEVISDLTSEETYYYRSYATNINGVAYGNVLTFATLAAPSIATATPVHEGSFATLGGTILELGGGSITERGIIYATDNTNLEIGETGVVKRPQNTSDLMFSQTIYNLNFSTDYYTRAYFIVDILGTLYTIYGAIESFTTTNSDVSITFLGTEDEDWFKITNWNLNRLPNSNDNVIVESEATLDDSEDVVINSIEVKEIFTINGSLTINELTASVSAVNLYGDLTVNNNLHLEAFGTNDLNIFNEGSLIIYGTYSGEGLLRYRKTANINQWYLISSPFADNSIYEYVIFDNNIASSGTNYGYAPYNNSYTGASDVWEHIQSSDGRLDNFPTQFIPPYILDPAVGYATSHTGTSNAILFTGTPQTNDVSISMDSGSMDSYNLIGNPYPSYLEVNALLNANSSILEEKTLWSWDSTTESYVAHNLINAYKIPPSTGFFVKSTANGGTLNVTKTVQTHERSSTTIAPQIELSITDGADTKKTNIYYSDSGTTGLDNGYDSSIFEGYRPEFPENLSEESLKLYTALVSDQVSEKLMIQTLPNSNHETMIIPLGVEATSGTTITFNATSFNFTTPVFIEDRQEGTFHPLNFNNFYEVTLTSDLNGVGRFYLRLDQVYPILTTTIENVDDSFATMGGVITETGGSTITERGVVYATSNSNLQIGESGVVKQIISSSDLTFFQQVFNLDFETTYYVRSYIITNEFAIVYGPEETFTTSPEDTSTITFLGTVDSDWSNPANWNLNRLPNSSDNIIIEHPIEINSSTQPIIKSIRSDNSGAGGLTIHGSLTVNDVTMTSSINLFGDLTINNSVQLNLFLTSDIKIFNEGSLILKGAYSGAGVVRYNRTVPANEWFLMSSPFPDNTIYEFANADNTIASSGTNHAYAPYNNAYTGTNDVWDYIQTSEIPTNFPPNFNPPHILDPLRGYATSIANTGSNNLKFIGSGDIEDVSISINTGSTDSYNLIGNPYPSYLNANALLSTNSSILEEQTLWTWDESTETYRAYNLINSYEIPPTTGFFVQSTANGGTFNVTESMQMHDSNSISAHPQIELSVTDGTDTKITNIYYSDIATTGFDNGYDSSIFEGYRPEFPENLSEESLKLYTALVSDQVSEKLMIQTLPNSNHETMIIPLGVEATSGTTITFNATSFNFTTPVFIEDRQEGTFHLLSDGSTYQVNLSETLMGVGRFYLRANFSQGELTNTWQGGSMDWNSKSNWDLAFVPIETVNVVIPKSPLHGMNYPEVNEDISVNKIELNAGSSLTVNGTITNNDTIVVNSGASLIADSVTGLITYKRFLPEDNWFMISSPVEGLTIEDFIAANNLAVGNGNVGLQEFDPATGWSIFQENSTGSMNSGQGYVVRLPQAGEISFTGSLPSSDSSIDIQQGAYNFNLIGNPFPSYIPINSNALQSLNILDHNSEGLSEMTIWIWDQSIASYKTINQSSDPFFLSPGQGFFVSSNSGPSSFGISRNIQGHQEDVFFRTSTTNSSTKIALSITDSTSTRSTEIYFGEGSTRGFDNGYDSSHIGFLPDELAIFTQLLENSEGNNYAIQTLPSDDVENIEIPIGVNSVSGVEIDFTAEVRNLPNGVMLYLEDRENNTFTRLDEINSVYSIALENGSTGVGRFYLHTSTEVLSNSSFEDDLQSVSLFMIEEHNLRITGLLPYETEMKMYNIHGQQIFQTMFLGKERNTIKIPTIAAGIYIVLLKSNGNLMKKKLFIE